VVSFNGGCFREGLHTAVLERIPALLSSDDYGSSVEREGFGQVLWAGAGMAAGSSAEGCGGLGLAWSRGVGIDPGTEEV
jgi:hypothetical protein